MEVLATSRTPKNQILLSDMSISFSLSLVIPTINKKNDINSNEIAYVKQYLIASLLDEQAPVHKKTSLKPGM